MSERFEPWPIRAIRDQLVAGDTLNLLCRARVKDKQFDVREHLLENLSSDVIRQSLAVEWIVERAELRRTLGVSTTAVPARSRPDIVIEVARRLHILEVKSSKTNDNRSQRVLDKAFREHLRERGHSDGDPWEVEQDLIKLLLFADRFDTIVRGATHSLPGCDSRLDACDQIARATSSPVNFKDMARTRNATTPTRALHGSPGQHSTPLASSTHGLGARSRYRQRAISR